MSRLVRGDDVIVLSSHARTAKTAARGLGLSSGLGFGGKSHWYSGLGLGGAGV